MAKPSGTRKRLFATVWERGAEQVAFNNATTGAQVLVVNANDFSDRVRQELMIYGIRQIFPDSVSDVVGFEGKCDGMRTLHKEMLAGEWQLGARAAKARLVMEPAYLAGRALGVLFPSEPDDAAARARWAGLTEYNRLRFAAREDVVGYLADNAPDAEDEDIFA